MVKDGLKESELTCACGEGKRTSLRGVNFVARAVPAIRRQVKDGLEEAELAANWGCNRAVSAIRRQVKDGLEEAELAANWGCNRAVSAIRRQAYSLLQGTPFRSAIRQGVAEIE
jgi:hypothetical protein